MDREEYNLKTDQDRPLEAVPVPEDPERHPRLIDAHTLRPILSHLPTPYRVVSSRNDGFDNFPGPLPFDAVELERRLSQNPDYQRQMADDEIGPPPEGGREAWLCVAGAFCVLFCIFGFGTSLHIAALL